MIIWWLFLIAATVALVKWIVSSAQNGSQLQQNKESALDILEKRYARGEIDREEFEQMKRDLSA